MPMVNKPPQSIVTKFHGFVELLLNYENENEFKELSTFVFDGVKRILFKFSLEEYLLVTQRKIIYFLFEV